jgi:hypothetical protein
MKEKYHWNEEDLVIERAEEKKVKKSVQEFIEDMRNSLNQKKIINKSHTE